MEISTLMLGTIIAALVIGVVLLVRFRSRHGKHPMAGERERNIGQIRRDGGERP